jgi:hypothetical protein
MNTNNENKTHPHAALIKAWAEGAEIQYFNEHAGDCGEWCNVINNTPLWDVTVQYRIKPEEPSNEPWKPNRKEIYFFVNTYGATEFNSWFGIDLDNNRYEIGNCFKTRKEAEAVAERVKAALKGTTDVSANVGSNVGSKDAEIKALKEELETLKLKISKQSCEKFQLDGKPLTDGEIALIKAIREVKIARIPEYRTSVLCFPSEDTDTYQVWCSDTPIAFLASSLCGTSKHKAFIDALKKIKTEQEANQ